MIIIFLVQDKDSSLCNCLILPLSERQHHYKLVIKLVKKLMVMWAIGRFLTSDKQLKMCLFDKKGLDVKMSVS